MTRTWGLVCAALLLVAVGCDGDDIDSDTEARRAYLGFDNAIDKAIGLGFDGFNAASSANIPPQDGVGDVDGTMTISGQVDQGASSNKEMRLLVDLVAYADDAVDDPNTDDEETIELVYDTLENAPPELDMSLKNIPTGTFTGTLIGTFVVSGDLDAEADFNLALSGNLAEDAGGNVIRAPGTLAITGTVTSGDGTFDVDVLK